MSPSSTVHGGQHDTKYVTFELLMHAAFVANEIWGFTPEPARRWRLVTSYHQVCIWSMAWVRVPPSAYSYKIVGVFSCAQIDSRRARERELATFDEPRRAVGMLNPMRDKNWRYVPGGRRDDIWNHRLPRSLKVKLRRKIKRKISMLLSDNGQQWPMSFTVDHS